MSGPAQSRQLQARSGWPIPNEVRPERPPAALRAAIDMARGFAPGARLRSITATYNCGGMVFASRRVWVDPADFFRILDREDKYRRLSGVEEAEIGDIVIYHDGNSRPCHVGVVANKNVLVPGQVTDPLVVLSKWGADGEYYHDSTAVPLWLGRPAQYWTDRRLP